jgi:hypothetical protein
MDTPNTAVPPIEAPAEEKIEFSEAQQQKIESIIREVSGRVAADLRAENKRLQRELEAAKSTPATPDLSRDLELTKAELIALRKEAAESKLTEQLHQAAGDTFLSSLGVRLMRDSVKIGADGKPVVVDEAGNPRLNAQFAPMTLAELAQAVADQHKYLARGTTRYGAGSTPSQGALPKQEPKLEDLFGRKSSGALANQLAMKSPTEYKRLKGLAQQKGLI